MSLVPAPCGGVPRGLDAAAGREARARGCGPAAPTAVPTVLPAEPIRVEEPTSRPAPFAEFEALPEGTLAQYLDGTLYMSPAPRPRHQDVVQNLYAALRAYAAEHGGYAGLAPFDVYLEAEQVVQPDVFYLAPERRGRIDEERGVEGAPTLVAEVLSPSTAYLDLAAKRKAYEESDLEEYWVLDPGAQSVMVLTRERPGLAGLARTAYVYERGPVASTALPGFEVEAADVFARP